MMGNFKVEWDDFFIETMISEIIKNSNNSNKENISRDIHLIDYSRCYVEDYMLVEVGNTVFILLPSCYIDDDNSWSEILNSDSPKQ